LRRRAAEKPRISAADTGCRPVLFLHYQEGRRFDIQSDAPRLWHLWRRHGGRLTRFRPGSTVPKSPVKGAFWRNRPNSLGVTMEEVF
jgi:hypothetical protein